MPIDDDKSHEQPVTLADAIAKFLQWAEECGYTDQSIAKLRDDPKPEDINRVITWAKQKKLMGVVDYLRKQVLNRIGRDFLNG